MDVNAWGMNYFDVIIASIVIILGIKGMMNGLVKEFFGIVGLIGGVYIASRTAKEVGHIIDKELFHINNPAALELFGFVAVLAGVWILSILIGSLFAKLTQMSGLGFFDALLGFVFGAGKYFLVFALIVTALSNVTLVKDNMQHYINNSILYPYLKSSGSFLINIDPNSFHREGVQMETNATAVTTPKTLHASLENDNLTVAE